MEQRPYITCRQLIGFIALYVTGELDEAGRLDFDRHLDLCVSCRAYLASYRQTMTMARAVASDDEILDDVPEELILTILSRITRARDAVQ